MLLHDDAAQGAARTMFAAMLSRWSAAGSLPDAMALRFLSQAAANGSPAAGSSVNSRGTVHGKTNGSSPERTS